MNKGAWMSHMKCKQKGVNGRLSELTPGHVGGYISQGG